MSTRERIMAIAVLAIIVVAGGAFLFQQLILGPIRDKEEEAERLQKDIDQRMARIAQVRADKPKFDRWKSLSLPADADLAMREYEKYLGELMRKSGVTSLSISAKKNDPKSSPQVPGKGPVYSKLTFTVVARGDLDHLVQMLEGFYRTSLLHQVRNLSIQRPLTISAQQRAGDLDLNLTIVALIVTGADPRPHLIPSFERRLAAIDVAMGLRGGPVGLGGALWAVGPTGPLGPGLMARPLPDYASIALAGKNIFMGRPPGRERGPDLDFTQFVRLTTISTIDGRTEAKVYDRYSGGKETRLRATAGFDTFKVRDAEDHVVASVKVVRISQEDAELILLVNDKYYSMKAGEDLSFALRKPLTSDRIKALGLATAAAPPKGKEDD